MLVAIYDTGRRIVVGESGCSKGYEKENPQILANIKGLGIFQALPD
jgi:hypothetical protein